MVEVCVGPSELHLKKELTALRKARFLRDPETCSSWRSPLSTKSFNTNNNNGTNNINNLPKSQTPKSSTTKRKKVYLYNWRHQSLKSNERSEEDESLGDEEEESIRSKSDTCPTNADITPVRRVLRRVKRNNHKKIAIRNSSKLLLETINTTTNNNSNNNSRTGSPFFSGSCGSWSNPARILRNMRRERENSSLSCTPVSTSSYYGNGVSFDADELLENKKGCGIPCYFAKRPNFYSNSPSLSGTNNTANKRLTASIKRKYLKNGGLQSPVLPLLSNGGVQSEFDSDTDEISTNFGELDLEAVSRLDGRRWSTSCKSIEGFDTGTIGTTGTRSQRGDLDEQRSLTQKYRPRNFEEIIGQNLITQSLTNASLRGKIAPAYLFQGPRGTGKTSTARVFSSALNCTGAGTTKPCNACPTCLAKTPQSIEIDATNRKGMTKILQKIPNGSGQTRYTVFIIDECHMVSSKTWSAFVKLLDEPSPRVVFVLVAVEAENIPRAIVSRCQRFVFGKIKEGDVMGRLRGIVGRENLDADLDALDLIAMNCDGSLRDAVTMLDQLSLLGKKITANLVNDLVGVVSDEKLLDLLETAMSSDTSETVRRSRELMDSGIDPMALMSQLAGLIMDIIAGSSRSTGTGTALGGRNLTEGEMERLQQALKILSDAEKQIRLSSERSTWFTAALLQLGTGTLSEAGQSRASSKHSKQSVRMSESTTRASSSHCESSSAERKKMERMNNHGGTGEDDEKKLEEVWRLCIERCHSNSLRLLLSQHGKLISVTESKNQVIVSIAFENQEMKSRAEQYVSSITDSAETVLRRAVQIKLVLKPRNQFLVIQDSSSQKPLNPISISEGGSSSQKRTNQRLENAWLQTGIVKPEKNQVLPQAVQNAVAGHKRVELDEELIREIKALKIGPGPGTSEREEREKNGYAISPSLLHSKNYMDNLDKEQRGYESGPGCNGLLCWRSQGPRVKKEIQRANGESNKSGGGLSLFGPCGKSKVKESRLKK